MKLAKAALESRKSGGKVSWLAGQSAEECVFRKYADMGHEPVAQRWRGAAGEIDLIFRNGDGLIFVEVKKSRSFELAAQHLSPAQMRRIWATAEEFLGSQPRGQLTDVRFDVALVDSAGALRIVENAFQ